MLTKRSAPRIPFHYQVSEKDCFPTAVINALIYLYKSDQIPGDVIRMVYLLSLDDLCPGGDISSKEGAKALIAWLNEYSKKEKKRNPFAIEAEILEEENVNLRKNNKIIHCLNKNGVALCEIWYPDNGKTRTGHTALALNHDSEWVYFWDPYYKGIIPKECKRNVRRSDSNGREIHNLQITKKWLDNASDKAYTLGKKDRFCILLKAQ